jgi:hypothetical protein
MHASQRGLIAYEMIFDIVGDLLAERRQVKQLVLDNRIIGPPGKLPKVVRARCGQIGFRLQH